MQDFRKDITSLLDKFTNNQDVTMKFMRENITEMKTQLSEIKVSIDSLNNEQNSIKTQISDIVNKNNVTENKIQSLESEVTQLKLTVPVNSPNHRFDENFMRELQERTIREKNIIIVGIPESKAAKTDGDQSADMTEVTSILNTLVEICPNPSRIFRLGKYNPTKDRNIKVCFESPQTAKLLLRNKDKLTSGIKIFSDQTPAQQNYLKELKNELELRTANGEKDITIKYVKGIPTIVTNKLTKN